MPRRASKPFASHCDLLRASQTLLVSLGNMGIKEVQVHEPALVLWDSSDSLASMYATAYSNDKVQNVLQGTVVNHPPPHHPRMLTYIKISISVFYSI